MDDWEDVKIVPLPTKAAIKSNWDDEDVDENDVKDSWEDEDEEAIPVPAVQPPQKVSTKPAAKGKAGEATKKGALDPLSEKLRLQRLVEEKELISKQSDEKTLDGFIPISESDFMEYAELIAQKLRPYEKSFHYIGLLKTVIRLSMVSLKASDAKEIASTVTAIANEKLKAEKEANAGKKKGGKKKQLLVDKADDALVANYDALDDYDYM